MIRFEPSWALRFRKLIGRRGSMLLVLGSIDIVYGIALLEQAWYPPGTAFWWPSSLSQLYGLPIYIWGVVWVGVGLFLFTGIPRSLPDWPQFTAAVAIKVWWAFTAILASSYDISTGSWGPGAIYTGFALIVLISAGWEDPP